MEILKHQQEDDDAVDLDSSIVNLRSLLERRNQELDGLEQSVTITSPASFEQRVGGRQGRLERLRKRADSS